MSTNMKLLLYFTFLITIRGVPTLVHQNINIAYGSNFQNYLITKSDEKIIECSISFSVDDNNITQIINLPLDIQEEKYYNLGMYQNRVSSIGHTVCGFKITNVTKNDPSKFMINVIYSNSTKSNNKWNSTFQVNYYENNEKILKVDLGDKFEINCQASDPIACLIINPQGEEVLLWKKPCIYTIHHVIQQDLGRWTCISSLKNEMEPLEEHVVLETRGPGETGMVKTWYKEENGYGVIGCQYINKLTGVGELPEYCQFQMPDQNMLILTDTLATARYTTLGLNLTQYLCQLEFPLPMLDAEKGLWTCYIGVTGGMINTISKSDPPFKKEHEIWVQPGDDGTVEKIEIFCHVPYMTNSCYIESPTGVTYTNNILNSWLGLCKTPSLRLNLTLHVGEWKCHFSRPDKALDDIIKVHVIKYEAPSQTFVLEPVDNLEHIHNDDDL